MSLSLNAVIALCITATATATVVWLLTETPAAVGFATAYTTLLLLVIRDHYYPED